MRVRSHAWLAIFVIPAMFCLSACGGDNDEASTVEPLFTTEELDDLVLLKEDLGIEYDRLRFDPRASGVYLDFNFEDVVLDKETTDVFQRAVERGGHVNGYVQAYNHHSQQPVSEGPVYFFSQVDLFQDSEAAAQFFQDLEANPTTEQTTAEGDEFSEVVRFEVRGVGEAAFGETGSIEYSLGGDNPTRVTVYATRVIFHRGPFAAIVSVDRADQQDIEAHVVDLARMLDAKHAAALAD